MMPLPNTHVVVTKDSEGITRGIAIDGLHGTADSPVIVDGEWAEVDGGGEHRTFVTTDCSNLVVRNWMVHSSGPNNAVIHCERSQNIVFDRILGWDAGDGNAMPWLIYRSDHCVLQDCAGWGRGRKVFQCYCANDTKLLRCWGRWGGMTTPAPGSCGVFAPSYNCFRTTMLNCIGVVEADDQQLVNAIWLADAMDVAPWAGNRSDSVIDSCAAISAPPRDAFHIGAALANTFTNCVRATHKAVTPVSNTGVEGTTKTGRLLLLKQYEAWQRSPILNKIKTFAGADPLDELLSASITT